MRRTKIVATIGPASESPAVLADLIAAGMDVARIGLAHGTVEEHLERLARIREAAAEVGKPVGVLIDLPGPKIRCGEFTPPGVDLVEGSKLTLVPGEEPSTASCINIDYEGLLEDVEPGDPIVLGDGAVILRVEQVRTDRAEAMVEHGGRVQARPGAHLPAEKLRLPTPTDEDLELLQAMVPAGVDIVAVSFVRDGRDVARVREAVAAFGPGGPMVMAKIETAAAVNNLDDVIAASDAVMVARGDLAIECALDEVPHLQKRIVRQCVAFGRPVITATQVLESMVHAATPTRAEVSDVANAVFDGTDALMLSGETAIGHDPALTVRTMARIAERAERESDYVGWGRRLGRLQSQTGTALPTGVRITAAISAAAWRAALDVEATAIICCTRSGATARAIARFRPTAPLLGVTPSSLAAHQLSLTWGVIPLVTAVHHTTDELVWFAVEAATELGIVRAGDVVAVAAGSPDDPESATDVLRLVRVR